MASPYDSFYLNIYGRGYYYVIETSLPRSIMNSRCFAREHSSYQGILFGNLIKLGQDFFTEYFSREICLLFGVVLYRYIWSPYLGNNLNLEFPSWKILWRHDFSFCFFLIGNFFTGCFYNPDILSGIFPSQDYFIRIKYYPSYCLYKNISSIWNHFQVGFSYSGNIFYSE